MPRLALAVATAIVFLLSTRAAGQRLIKQYWGNSADDWFGISVSGAGDVNKDGWDDVVIGAVYDDYGARTDCGSITVFSGKTGFILFGPIYGNGKDDWFGNAVSGVGDVNKDGHADFLGGAPKADLNASILDSGMATVFSGKDGKTHRSPIYGWNAGDWLGVTVSGAGDVNRDGHDDLIIGVRRWDGGSTLVDSGLARLLSGKDFTVLGDFKGVAAGDEFGASVSGAGDVNNDGYLDVIVGAHLHDKNGTLKDAGMARVFSGKDRSILHTFYGDDAGDFFGLTVSGVGDLNRDGHDDVVVGAYLADYNGVNSGVARVFSGKDGSVLYNFVGDSPYDWFGVSVSGAGDVDRDGVPDLIVGAMGDDNNGKQDSGSARVFSGVDGTVLHTFDGGAAGDHFGISVSDAGDFDNDKFPDVIVGAHLADSSRTNAGSASVLTLGQVGTHARFDADVTIGSAPLTVKFTDKSFETQLVGGVFQWNWTFGDGGTSTDRHPSHTYTKPGVYDVSEKIKGQNGSGALTRKKYIHVCDSTTNNGSLTTRFDGGIELAANDVGYLFDLQVNNPKGVKITTIDIHSRAAVSTAVGIDVYIHGATHVGNDNDRDEWVKVSSGSGPSQGGLKPTPIDVADFYLAQGTYGVYIVYKNGGAHHSNGALTWENCDLRLMAGLAKPKPFTGGTVFAAGWNGTLHYAANDKAAQGAYPYGCKGSNGKSPWLALSGDPVTGNTVNLEVNDMLTSGGSGLLFIGVQKQMVDLAVLGMPKCLLLTNVLITAPFVNTGGKFSLPIKVPIGNDGLILHLQAAAVDKNANALGLAASNGTSLRIGK